MQRVSPSARRALRHRDSHPQRDPRVNRSTQIDSLPKSPVDLALLCDCAPLRRGTVADGVNITGTRIECAQLEDGERMWRGTDRIYLD